MPENPPESSNDLTSEANILSFIVRVWREDLDAENSEKVWRGHIMPIPDGERRYFSDINEIPAFIAAHLKAHL